MNKSIIQNGYCTYEFENSKTSEHHRLLLNLADKRNLKRRHIYVAWSNLSM